MKGTVRICRHVEILDTKCKAINRIRSILSSDPSSVVGKTPTDHAVQKHQT